MNKTLARQTTFVLQTTVARLTGIVVVSALTFCLTPNTFAQTLSYNQDIRPILASKCFACHGPDENHQEAGLRLDQREVAIEMAAIDPGDPDSSELVERIFSDDSEMVMPPPETGDTLSNEHKRLLKRWISEGAKYETHWAFEHPKSAKIPAIKSPDWVRNPIDHFVFNKLEQQNLTPSGQADRYTLIRRLYIDLIGLLPTIAEADAFANSNDPEAYEKLVEKLLTSKHYGERWAQPWLDLARYSDTNGYEKDRPRSIWPYRDWVINALNDDMPYDQFSIEQLAGDMLPNPTIDQRIATGFHRNTMLNEEGGIDPLEYRYLAMVDRVATTGTVWMGLTIGCAQCHTHKYDPISHEDYFSMMALMNNAAEPDLPIPDKSRLKEIAATKKRIRQLERDLERQFPLPDTGNDIESENDENPDALAKRRKDYFDKEFARWLTTKTKQAAPWKTIRPAEMKTNMPKLELQRDGSIFAMGDTTKRDVYELTFKIPPQSEPIQALQVEALPDDRLPDRGPGKTYYEGRKGDFFLSEIDAELDGNTIKFSKATHAFSTDQQANQSKRIDQVFDGVGSSGWSPGKQKSQRLTLVLNLKEPIEFDGVARTLKIKMLFERHYTVSLGKFRISSTTKKDAQANLLPNGIERLLLKSSQEKWNAKQAAKVKRLFLMETPLLTEQRKTLIEAKKNTPSLNYTLVLQEQPASIQRETFLHHRGEYLAKKQKVQPAIPQLFRDSDEAQPSAPSNRLEMARWLVSDQNPLASRVAVNRAWREFFGAGLMRTNGDFGVQSAPPTHPELLDWLAVHFQTELNWSLKSLHRLIVTSATYRQSSLKIADSSDDENRTLARGPAFRIPGETFRDICLQASGTLSQKMFGPGVRPPQPASVTALAYRSPGWPASKGEDRFRRSIYTYRKRTAAFAAYTVFDGPTGENCIAKRNRSNTPLQALTVLNDEMFQELARILGSKISDQQLSDEAAIEAVFRAFLIRPPSESELRSMNAFYNKQLQRLQSNDLQAEKLNGPAATDRQAALTMLARTIMNLDEAITKR